MQDMKGKRTIVREHMKELKRIFSILFLLAVFFFAGCTAGENDVHDEQTPEKISFDGREYTLAFEDEFEFFDESKWSRLPEIERQDVGGVWSDSCCDVQDGNLVITCAAHEDGTPVSGGVRSSGEYERTYGLYHIRFKAEDADGLWYAFWLLTDRMEDGSVGNGATDGAEIDIFEFVPHTGEFCMSVHWDGYGEELRSRFETYYPGDSFFGVYHDVWFLWYEDGYRLYLDGTSDEDLIFDFPGSEYGDGTCRVPCDMIISAEFGSWGGEIDESRLPSHLYVDCVQIYSLKDSEEWQASGNAVQDNGTATGEDHEPVSPVEPDDAADLKCEFVRNISADTWRSAFEIYKKTCNAGETVEEIKSELSAASESEEELNADLQAMEELFSYWDKVNEDDFINAEDIQNGLPGDNSLCIVILGYSLSPYGEVRDELMCRLDAGIEVAEKYPNAYVLVTGGGTALLAPAVKEADKMAEYLIENGIDPSRIIVENNSLSTSENAVYSERILRDEYPEIRDLFLVSSDYHIPMACQIFEGWFIMRNSDLEVISNYACHPGNPVTFKIRDQVYWMEELLYFL